MKFVLAIFVFALLVGNLTVHAETDAERRKRLELELQQVERQILQQKVLVEDKQLERQSLERDLDLLDAEIKKAQLGIQARSVAIQQLSDQILDKEEAVVILNERLGKQEKSLAELMRKTQAIDDYSLVEVLLSNQNFSQFFTDFESFRAINDSLRESLELLQDIKRDTITQKLALEEKQQTEAELKDLQEIEKQTIEARESEKEEILEVTRGEEQAYQELLESQQKTASQLRAQLFDLLGGGGAIPFPEAVELAKVAGRQAGISPALVLAILEQESAYGSNIGSCIYDDLVHGRAVMHPDRDAPVFVAMAETLGFDPRVQQISCPWIRAGERIGWGGAMGPSQFIPSTWAIYGGFENNGAGWEYNRSNDAIRALLGSSLPSSPFRNQDAFLATALYMRDQGASGGTYDAEWRAAIRYFAGWNGPNNVINHPYGDNVMARKARLEREIQILGGA